MLPKPHKYRPTHKMPRQLRDDWCDKLDSGKYEQCTMYLHRIGDGYCCLGILGLCLNKTNDELAGAYTIVKEPSQDCEPAVGLDLSQDEAGITPTTQDLLTHMNDGGYCHVTAGLPDDSPHHLNFKQISTWIRKNIPVKD